MSKSLGEALPEAIAKVSEWIGRSLFGLDCAGKSP